MSSTKLIKNVYIIIILKNEYAGMKNVLNVWKYINYVKYPL
jgi:hypothetical protein